MLSPGLRRGAQLIASNSRRSITRITPNTPHRVATYATKTGAPRATAGYATHSTVPNQARTDALSQAPPPPARPVCEAVTLVREDQRIREGGINWKPGSSQERPLDRFTYGAHPIPGNQVEPVTQVRIPKLPSLEVEREWRKLHQAVALRWLGQNGYNNEGGGGHVTVRDPILPDHFWINPHNKSFSHMTPEDLCLVNEEGIVVGPGNMHAINPAGFSIHLAVHQARPDVVAACHCHSVPSKAFSALGCELEPINQDACRFYEDHAVYNDFGGIVLAAEEGRRIANAIGTKKAVILQNHGILTVGKSVDGAVFLFGAMDRCIQAQLMADAAAAGRGKPTVKISHEAAEYTRRVYTDEMEYNMFQSAFEDVVLASNGELAMHVDGEQRRLEQ